MAKFELGDDVKIVRCSNEEYLGKVGTIKTVVEDSTRSVEPMYNVYFSDVGYRILLNEDQLEKVPAPEAEVSRVLAGGSMSDYEKRFFATTDELRETFLKKNRDYGNSFSDTIQKFGIKVAVARIHDKYMRVENMVLGKEMNINESLRDNLMDIANYCILTLIELEPQKGEA